MNTLKLIKRATYVFEENVHSNYFLPLSKTEFIIQGSHYNGSINDVTHTLFHIKDNKTSTFPLDAHENYISHPKGLLVYKNQALWWYKKGSISNPIIIKFNNTFQNREWVNNIETVSVSPSISALGMSDSNIIPVNVIYGRFRSRRQLSLLKVNFEKREASIVFDKYRQFITLNYYDLLKHKDYNMSSIDKDWAFSEEKRTDGVLDNYYDHHAQMLFENTLIKNNKLYFFSSGTNSNYMKYGMNYVCLGVLEKSLFNKRYTLRKTLFFQDENELDSGKNGKEGRFTTSRKYCIITPVFKTSDAWGSSEKLLDLHTERLFDVELPRGYKTHNIIDHYDNCFWTHGTNKEKHTVITRFEVNHN